MPLVKDKERISISCMDTELKEQKRSGAVTTLYISAGPRGINSRHIACYVRAHKKTLLSWRKVT